MSGKGDRGRSAISCAALIVLIGAVFAVVSTGDIPGKVAKNCEGALCRLSGGDCPNTSPQAQARTLGDTRPVSLLEENPDAMGGVGGLFPREPIPKPTCNPDPKAKWAEGLHAHNDYSNGRPLLDALDNGATSVEVDLFLGADGALYAKHDYEEAKGVMFKESYVDKLMKRAEENDGQIYPGRDPKKPFQVIVELKEPNMQEGEIPRWVVDDKTKESYLYSKRVDAYWAVIRQTRELRTMYPNVQVVFSGGAPRDLVGKPDPLSWEVPRNVVYDISPGDDCSLPPEVDPYALRQPTDVQYDLEYAENFVMLNGNWDDCGDRDHDGEISREEQQKLNDIVQRAHNAGLKVRLYDGPDGRVRANGTLPGLFTPCHFSSCSEAAKWAAWKSRQQAGVDYLNTNHLTNGRDWIRYCGLKPESPGAYTGPLPQPSPAPSPYRL
ncbi:hypothetical protein ACQEU6_03010 [Spirillospora sp. CA-108201]